MPVKGDGSSLENNDSLLSFYYSDSAGVTAVCIHIAFMGNILSWLLPRASAWGGNKQMSRVCPSG